MTIELYCLVDSSGRIIYTESDIKRLETYKEALNNNDLQIITLKGELNV